MIMKIKTWIWKKKKSILLSVFVVLVGKPQRAGNRNQSINQWVYLMIIKRHVCFFNFHKFSFFKIQNRSDRTQNMIGLFFLFLINLYTLLIQKSHWTHVNTFVIMLKSVQSWLKFFYSLGRVLILRYVYMWHRFWICCGYVYQTHTDTVYTDNPQPCSSCPVAFSQHRTEDVRPGVGGHGTGQGGQAGWEGSKRGVTEQRDCAAVERDGESGSAHPYPRITFRKMVTSVFLPRGM